MRVLKNGQNQTSWCDSLLKIAQSQQKFKIKDVYKRQVLTCGVAMWKKEWIKLYCESRVFKKNSLPVV